MEWREQSTVSCEVAFAEARRWVEVVTGKRFGSSNFRSALENGVLLCDLINKLKPGIIRRVNRLSTPIAGLDNVNVFLRACGKLGLNHSQLFHPGDLQDISNRVTVRREETTRRLKNVLITIYWLGRKAQADPVYSGPQLNFKAFEGLLGVALSKVLEESSCPKAGVSARDGGHSEVWQEPLGTQTHGYRRGHSVESLDSLSAASDHTLLMASEGFGSDAEAERCFRMSEGIRSESGPASGRDRGSMPTSLRRKRVERHKVGGRDTAAPLPSENWRGLAEPWLELPPASAFHQRAHTYQSDTDSDSDRPEPDLVQDDLASRRFRSTTSVTPMNYAVPPHTRKMWLFPSVTPSAQRSWVTMSDASRLSGVPLARVNGQVDNATLEAELLQRALNGESSDSDEGQGLADPIHDDLYSRKVSRAVHQTSVNANSDKFLPKHWTPEEDTRVRRIRLGSRRRPWYRKMQGFRATVRRSHLCGSKSMSDITLEPMQQTPNSNASFDPSGSHQDYTEQVQSWQMQQTQTREKDGEARWQDDLYRWKSHRRSVTSDLHRKKEEREQLQLLAGCRRTARHVGVQEESEWEGVLMFASCQPSRGIPQEPSAAQGPSTRAVPPSQPSAQGEDLHTGSMASNEAFAPSEASPLTSCCNMPRFTSSGVSDDKSTTQVDLASTPASPSENGAHSLSENASGRSCHTDPGLTDQTQEVVFFNPPEATSPTETSHTDWERPVPVLRAKSLEGGLSGGVCVSATLPRGFRRSEGGSRLSTGVTPRPFRAKPSKVASLPRFYSMDESCSSFTKSPRERPRLPASFTSQGQVVTPDTEGHAGSSLRQSSQKREEEFGEKRQSAPNIHSFMSASVVAAASKPTPAPRSSAQSSKDEVGYSDMRISLNQKPRSGRDFGFQAHWDSTSAHIRSVQPGSPAQLCHLQVGDEIVCVAGRRVAEMSYEQWKACMDAALREGKLLMDVRRHGQNGWSNSPSSLPFKSHKTIDLTSMDSTLAGGPEHHVADDVTGPSLSLEKAGEAQVNGHPANGFSVKAEPESFCDDPVTRRNKEYEDIIMQNRKRRLEFFMQKGGSESAISDLQVPSISTSTSRWSWDTEEERKRQEKWQMEQERLLQEKYRRDQERLEEEWRRAQEAAAQSDCSGPEMQTQQRTPLPNGNTTSYTPPPFLYQSASSTSAVSSQRAAEAGPAQSRQETKPAGHQTKEECDSPSKASQWLCESYEFAKLTTLDRKKSKSTPSLDSHKIDSRAGGKKKGRLSQAERDRQQILEEMRKKTPLHTDSSWIRQQGTCSVSKEPITVAPMMRRDSLESLHPSSLPRHFSTQCSLGGAAPYRSTSSRRSLGPGSAIFSSTLGQRSVLPGQPAGRPAETVSSPQQRSRLVSGKRACSRCVRPLAKGTAVVIESLDLCFHIGCFKNLTGMQAFFLSLQHLFVGSDPNCTACNGASAASASSAGTPRAALRCACDADSSSVRAATAETESAPVSPSEQDADHGVEFLEGSLNVTALSTA